MGLNIRRRMCWYGTIMERKKVHGIRNMARIVCFLQELQYPIFS